MLYICIDSINIYACVLICFIILKQKWRMQNMLLSEVSQPQKDKYQGPVQ